MNQPSSSTRAGLLFNKQQGGRGQDPLRQKNCERDWRAKTEGIVKSESRNNQEKEILLPQSLAERGKMRERE
jgi:hypothetical protein